MQQCVYAVIENNAMQWWRETDGHPILFPQVEANLLSPYVSPTSSPFRHILLGTGKHTLSALVKHLDAMKSVRQGGDEDLLRNQFALATWTIQSCANALAGEVWDMNNNI